MVLQLAGEMIMDYMEMMFLIHQGLPREGPGNSDATRRAFAAIPDLPEKPDILDVGCGPGMQTLDLADMTGGRITALDYHEQYLDVLRGAVSRKGWEGRITIVRGDMNDMRFQPGTFDLIWSEGAIYIMGFEKGLRTWKKFLKDKGYIAVSELTWLKPDAPAELREFWDAEYSEMQDIDANLGTIAACGYDPAAHFVLPDAALWDNYYHPLEKRLEKLKGDYRNDPAVLRFLENEEREIGLLRKYSEYYGYVFYVMGTSR